MTDPKGFSEVTDKLIQASERIMHTKKDGLWISDGLSDRIIGFTFGQLVDLACKVESLHARGVLINMAPLDPERLNAKFSLLESGIRTAEIMFEDSMKNKCPHCGQKKEIANG